MSQRQIDAMLEKERIVMAARITGKSFYQIEKETGFHNCDRIFKRAIGRQENADVARQEAIRLENLRLDALQAGDIWAKALNGDSRAVEVSLKILERRAKLNGLDFADLVSSRLVEVEQAKVRLMATALVRALNETGASPEQKKAATRAFMDELRATTTEDTQAIVTAEVVAADENEDLF
jgi:hypothetical protein